MATLDAELRDVALALIAELGATYTFHLPTKSYNPASGETTKIGTTTATVKGTPPDQKKAYAPGEVVPEGSFYFYIAAKDLTFTPKVGFKVTLGTESFSIVSVDPVYSGEQVCIYGLQIHE